MIAPHITLMANETHNKSKSNSECECVMNSIDKFIRRSCELIIFMPVCQLLG
jgi:hypothetical protein